MLELLQLIKDSDIPFQTDVKSAKLCLYGGGGKLKIAVFPKTIQHLTALADILKTSGASSYVLGGFSNTLVKDNGFSGIAVFTKNLTGVWLNDNLLTCGAAETLPSVAAFAVQNSLAGLQGLAGIPSSIGGAVVMNAGAFGTEIKDVLDSVTTFDLQTCQTETCQNDNIPFAYRTSNGAFKNKIILSATFKLTHGCKQQIEALTKGFKLKRRATQPKEKSLGCVFKNGNGLAAGYFIEKARLKGCTANGAKISEKHANFIVNTGTGSAEDYITLLKLAKETVYRRFGVTLKEEVVIIGD
jgi:UDP-N-acetylmuramate dehydrogenase